MKKLVLALTAVAAFTGSASAADLGARPYAKAPVAVAPAYNWTGFYIFGGGGGGIWAADQSAQMSRELTCPVCTIDQRQGGSGWFGTVGLGYDWQFSGPGSPACSRTASSAASRALFRIRSYQVTGTIKMQDAWAAGVRVGYLVAPNVLSYVNGGYSGSHWSGRPCSILPALPRVPTPTASTAMAGSSAAAWRTI